MSEGAGFCINLFFLGFWLLYWYGQYLTWQERRERRRQVQRIQGMTLRVAEDQMLDAIHQASAQWNKEEADAANRA